MNKLFVLINILKGDYPDLCEAELVQIIKKF